MDEFLKFFDVTVDEKSQKYVICYHKMGTKSLVCIMEV